MTSIIKKSLALTISGVLALASLTACSGQKAETPANPTDNGTKMFKIGISQFAEHPSLDNCREGFIEGLKQAGFEEGKNVTFDYKNAQADMTTASQIATNFVASNYDMLVGVATPSAQTAFAAAEKKQIPVVYVAVSDPVGAQLVGDDGKSGKSVTGVSDLLPADKQLALIRKVLPNAKKIGVMYSTGEVNSQTQLKMLKDSASKYGFEIVESGIGSPSDVSLALDSLLGKVDCLNNMTDNLVVSALATILDKANAKKIPVFGSEVEQVKNGCVASEGIDYFKLGVQTGKMAARVLNGEDIKKIPFETVEESQTDVNTTALKNLGLTMPEEISKTATLHE